MRNTVAILIQRRQHEHPRRDGAVHSTLPCSKLAVLAASYFFITTFFALFLGFGRICGVMKSVLSLLCCLIFAICADGQADGWKMTDRFFAFRFEMFGDRMDKAVTQEAIK